MEKPKKSNKFRTRSTFNCPLFGTPKELTDARLPTHEDVLRGCFLERYNLKPDVGNQEPKFSAIAKIVAEKIEHVYNKSSIPIVSHNRIIAIVNNYYKKYQSLMKSYKRGKDKPNFQRKIINFVDDARKTLFDIAACKCNNFIKCNCEKQNRVPKRERAFLPDQRTTKLGYIGQLDTKCTTALQKNMERKNRIKKKK